MTKSIYIDGNEEFFIQHLQDRLLRAGATLVNGREDSDFVIAVGEDSLEISQLLVAVKNLGIPTSLSEYTTYFPPKEN